LASLIAKGDSELSKRQATLVVDEKGLLTGIITRGDMMRALHNQASIDLTVGEAASRDVAVTYVDETLNMALNKMLRKNIGRLAVVERGSPGKIVGYLGRASILAARLRFHQEEVLPEQERALVA
jgi:CBS domain-containing protein